MYVRSFGRLLCASLFLVAGIACDPLSPEDVAGTYVVRTVRSEPLPVVLWETESDTVQLVADTVRLRRNGTGTEVSIYEMTGDVQHVANRLEQDIEFEIRDGRLDGGYTCRGLCTAIFVPIRGVFTGEGLRLEVWKHGNGPIELERVN
jgi:hypothetical protein